MIKCGSLKKNRFKTAHNRNVTACAFFLNPRFALYLRVLRAFQNFKFSCKKNGIVPLRLAQYTSNFIRGQKHCLFQYKTTTIILCCVQQSGYLQSFAYCTIGNDVKAIVLQVTSRLRALALLNSLLVTRILQRHLMKALLINTLFDKNLQTLTIDVIKLYKNRGNLYVCTSVCLSLNFLQFHLLLQKATKPISTKNTKKYHQFTDIQVCFSKGYQHYPR